eukprot:scaffold2850_cov235-Pinguiococcus_pyrenoidosus.AAC.11
MSKTEAEYEVVSTRDAEAAAEAVTPPAGAKKARVPMERTHSITEDGKGILAPRDGKLLEWSKLNYSVFGKGGKHIRVLEDNFGRVPPGQVSPLPT